MSHTDANVVETANSVRNRLSTNTEQLNTLVATLSDEQPLNQVETEIIFEHLKVARDRIASVQETLDAHFTNGGDNLPYTVPKGDVNDAYETVCQARTSLNAVTDMMDDMELEHHPFPVEHVDGESVDDVVSNAENRVTLACDMLADAKSDM